MGFKDSGAQILRRDEVKGETDPEMNKYGRNGMDLKDRGIKNQDGMDFKYQGIKY